MSSKGWVSNRIRLRRLTPDLETALEEGVFFPAVHGLNPESTPELNRLAREHRRFLADLDDLHDELATRKIAEITQALSEFIVVTAAHEGREVFVQV